MGLYYLVGLLSIPVVPILFMLFPIFFVFYWLFGEDEDLGSSAGICSYYTRPSIQVISYLWLRGENNHFACCIPCPCLRDRERLASFLAASIVVLFWLPISLVISLIVSAFLGVFGSIFAWFYILAYIVKITYKVMKMLF